MEPDSMTPLQIPPFNWLKDATIFNKNGDKLQPSWLEKHADAIVLLFTSHGVDKEGIVKKFYNIYESVKMVNVALEVIYVPLDETKQDYIDSYAEQANWFTLGYDNPIVPIIIYSYGISSLPHMLVIKPDCNLISLNGILDLEAYGKNAVITWLGTPAECKINRNLGKEVHIYGTVWKYAGDKKVMSLRFSESSGLTMSNPKKQ